MIIHSKLLFNSHDSLGSTETHAVLESNLCLVRKTVMSWLQTLVLEPEVS